MTREYLVFEITKKEDSDKMPNKGRIKELAMVSLTIQ